MTGPCGSRIATSRAAVSVFPPRPPFYGILRSLRALEMGSGTSLFTICGRIQEAPWGARDLCEISLSARIGDGSSVVSARASISSHTTVLALAFRDHRHQGAARTDVGY